MADNKKYKRLPIEKIEDAVFVMRALISNVMNNLYYYEKYTKELGNLYNTAFAHLLGLEEEKLPCVLENSCKQMNDFLSKPKIARCYYSATDECAVPGDTVHDVRDKILYRQSELFKFFGDEQKDSFSYINVRKQLKKKGFLKGDPEERILQLLNQLNRERNNTAHFSQSNLVGVLEAQRHNYKDKGLVQRVYNPVTSFIEKRFSIEFVGRLYVYSKACFKAFSEVFISMKDDYQLLYEQLPDEIKSRATLGENTSQVEYRYEPVFNDGKLEGDESIRVSKMIQKNQYDGSEESFKKAKR